MDFSSTNGILPIIKPPGPSSQDIVSDVKRLLKIKKVGHAGTLDPAAGGVLPVCVGKATRLFDYLIERDKSYRCEVEFGIACDTIDSYGEVTKTDSDIDVSMDCFKETIAKFEGEILQRPPIYSALKSGGKKLYELARSGVSSEEENEIRNKKKRIITIKKIKAVEQTGTNRFMFDVDCSKGTYIRVLCEDIANSLETVGYMRFLLRTKSAGIDVSDGITLDELKNSESLEKLLIPMNESIDHLPKIYFENRFYDDISNGKKIAVSCENTDTVSIFCGESFMGMGSVNNNVLRVKALLI